MSEVYLRLSIAINVVLAVALFFKSALNQIVIDWVESKRTKRDLFMELHNQVSSFAKSFGDICFYEYLFSLDPSLRKTSQPVWQGNFQEFTNARKFILDNRLRFSDDLQRIIDRLFDESKLDDVLKNPNLYEECSGRVNSIAQEIKTYIKKRI